MAQANHFSIGALGRGGRSLLALPVLLLGLLLTALVYRYAAHSETRFEREQFEDQVLRASILLDQRFTAYEQILRGGVGLFAASREVSRSEWRRYADELELQENYPGIQGIGFARRLAPGELAAHERAVRAEGFPAFRVWPEGARDEYTSIDYLEPFSGRNLRAFGYDMHSEPARRDAMDRARDEGRPTLTGRVTLVQEEGAEPQAGVLLYLPVYRPDLPRDTVAERRAALLGWVYSPFRIGDLVAGVYGSRLNVLRLDIADETDAARTEPLYASRPSSREAADATPLEQVTRFEYGGRFWRLRYTALPGFHQTGALLQPPWILVVGSAISLLLALLVLNVGRAERRARAIAQAMSAAREASESRYRAVVEALHEGVVLLDRDGRIIASNPEAERQFEVGGGLVGRSVFDDFALVHEDGSPWQSEDYPALRALRSGRPQRDVLMGFRSAAGDLRWLSVSATPIETVPGAPGRGILVWTADVTEKRRAEAVSRLLEQRFRLMVESVVDYGVFMLGPEGTVVSWNPGAERISGYRAEDILGSHFSRFYTPEDRMSGRARRELQIAAESGHYHEENWRLRKDGTRFWASVVINAMRDEGGKLIGFVKVTRDLTERRVAEQQLAEANRLRDAILDSAPYGIVAVDPEGRITTVNPAFAHMIWYEPGELIGTRHYETMVMPEEVAARAAELSAEAGRTIEPGFESLTYRAAQGQNEEREWTLVRKDGSRFPATVTVTALRDATGRITGFLGIAHDITERKRREDYTQHIAHHDFLTGLPNRTLLQDRLGRALELSHRSQRSLAVMMLDLDHFKRVNDSLGHHVGDQLLATVADRIVGCVRSSDTVARMGGDEFVILLPETDGLEGVERVAADIVDKVSAPMHLGAHELTVTPSLGISRFPQDAQDAHELLRHADTAMYLAKSSGRHGYRVFSEEMERAAQERLSLENALRRALRHEEFELCYQPQVCLATGTVIGMEALLRWTDPERGPVAPAEFIPLAEDSGLILPLGEWVLRRACREARALQRRTGLPLRLAVNLSARQFRDPGIVDTIAAALSESGLLPAHLEVEITEGVLMANTEETIARLRQIRAMGVSIAVDDFGVGFSSLSYIARFPIDTLKIDRAFVTNLPGSASDCAVAQAIIALARSLDIRVVAEGVETAQQVVFLREKSCGIGQGLHLGEPKPASMLSVQGFHFGPAVTADAFVEHLPELQDAGRRSAVLTQ